MVLEGGIKRWKARNKGRQTKARFVERERTGKGRWENSRTAVEVAMKHCKIYVLYYGT